MLYVPAARATVSPLGQEAKAALIWDVVAEEVRLAQFVVRAGIPPTPELDQLIACVALKIDDHDWAWLYSENTNNSTEIPAVLRLICPHRSSFSQPRCFLRIFGLRSGIAWCKDKRSRRTADGIVGVTIVGAV